MNHGIRRGNLQHPADWEGGDGVEPDKKPAFKPRKDRALRVGFNQDFEYCLGQNLFVASGRVTRDVKAFGNAIPTTWFRLHVPNQDIRGQHCFISVKSRGDLAQFVVDNVAKGAVVVVVGKMVSGTVGKDENRRFIHYVLAERISSSFPEQWDSDRRFVRVRADYWNRVCAMLEGLEGKAVPELKRMELLTRFAEMAGDDRIGDATEDEPDQGASTETDEETK